MAQSKMKFGIDLGTTNPQFVKWKEARLSLKRQTR